MNEELTEEVALRMLEYASECFENVDLSFFEGIKTLAEKIGKYLIKKGFVVDEEEAYQENISYWKLHEVDSNVVQTTRVSNAPWKEENSSSSLGKIAMLEDDSEYLPYGVDKKDESKKLVWHKAYARMNSNRKRIKRELSITEVQGIIEDFFSSISPMYGVMAHNELKRSKLTIPDEWYNDEDYIFSRLKQGRSTPYFSEENAMNTNISLTGSYTGIMIVAHELMHRMTEGGEGINEQDIEETDIYELLEKTPDFLNDAILRETTSILTEQLCSDYLKEKYKDVDTLDFFPLRWSAFAIYPFFTHSINCIETWYKMAKKYADGKNVDKEKLLNFLESTYMANQFMVSPELFTTNLLYSMNHSVAYIYTSYLHEKILSGELDAKETLDACCDALVCTHSDEEKQIELLEKIGAPFIKDGKFVIDDDAIDVMFNSVKSDINRRTRQSKNTRKYFKKGLSKAAYNLGNLKNAINEHREYKKECRETK